MILILLTLEGLKMGRSCHTLIMAPVVSAKALVTSVCSVSQSVYGVSEEGPQSQSPVHTPLHHRRKGTKEDVEKEVPTRAAAASICC